MKRTCSRFPITIIVALLLFTTNALAQSSLLDSVITGNALKEVVYQLAHDSLQGRLANSIGCQKAANIIADRMQAAGIRKIKGLNGYFQDLDEEFHSVRNVIGVLPGTAKPNEIILISAHYDHIGMADPFSGSADQIFNGANDDASGVAVMLSLATWFTTKSHQRTILFAAFSGEEIGLLGSRGFSATFFPDSIVAQINLEMLGRKGVYKRPLITGYLHSNLRNLLNEALKDSLQTDSYFDTDKRDARNLFMRSDNYPLAVKGVPAHTIMLTTDQDNNYHRVSDEPRTLDYNNMGIIARNIALALEPLVQAQVTPRRINPRTIPPLPPSFTK